MSSKDESYLNTGVSTAASRRIERLKAKEQQMAQHEKAQVVPYAERLLGHFDKELAGIYDMRAIFVDLKSPEAEIKAERLARAMHERFVNRLKTEVQKIIKDGKS